MNRLITSAIASVALLVAAYFAIESTFADGGEPVATAQLADGYAAATFTCW